MKSPRSASNPVFHLDEFCSFSCSFTFASFCPLFPQYQIHLFILLCFEFWKGPSGLLKNSYGMRVARISDALESSQIWDSNFFRPKGL